MENNFETPNDLGDSNSQPNQPTQPIQPTQPMQPVQPVQPVSPIQSTSTFPPDRSSFPGQIPPALEIASKATNSIAKIIGIIAGALCLIGLIVALLFIFVFNKPESGNSAGGSSDNGSSNSGNSGSVSKYANLPDTIDSCPGCVYTYTAESSIVYTPNNSTYTYKSLTSDQYKTNWKDVVSDSGHETFLGFILNDDNYPVRAYSCLAMDEKDTVFCLEGGVEDKYGGSFASRTEFYKSDKETLDYAFPDSVATTPDYLNDTDYKKVSGKYQALINLDGSSMRGVATTYDKDWVFCSVFNYGVAYCNEYWLK